MDRISKIFSKILPIYWAFLTYMLLRPGSDASAQWFLFPGFDKVIHIVIFMMLSFLFRCAYPYLKFLIFIQVMLIYALFTEILQGEMGLGRSMEFYDLVADTIGVLLGYFVFLKTKSLTQAQS